MSAISIGLSGLRVSQRSLDLIGQNIANAQTPGYHRQVANLAVRALADSGEGIGVEVNHVVRNRSGFVEQALLANAGDVNNLSVQTEYGRQLESLLAPGEGSIHDQIEKVFNHLQQLAADPSNQVQRRVVLRSAESLTNQLNDTAVNLSQFSDHLDQEGAQLVADANSLSERIADLNLQIQRATIQGGDTNNSRDQRDQLIFQLAEIADVQVFGQDFGVVNVVAAGLPVVVGTEFTPLSYAIDQTNQGVLTPAGSATVLQPSGGKLAGLLEFRNTVVPDYRSRLDTLANELASTVDHVQATGLGLKGPVSSAVGSRPVADITATLDQAGLAFPPQAGTLSVSVSAPDGTRMLSRIAIDPANLTLQALALNLGGLTGLQTVTADPQTNTLKITAAAGFRFDFAGRLSTVPDDHSAYTGSAAVQVSGKYTGAANDTYIYNVVGAGGTVGGTAGLALQVVRQSDNSVLGTVDVGAGYQPSETTGAIDGVSLRLGPGDLNPGDSFRIQVTADADTAQVLTALGINTFFSGANATDLKVRPDLLADGQQLAASRNGQPGDAANLEKLTALRDAPLLANGTQTFREFFAGMIGDAGTQVRDASDRETAAASLGQRLQAQQQSVSGVDPNEELVHLLKFQRAFQMSAKYLDVINRTLDELMRIVD